MRGAFNVGSALAGFSDTTIGRQRKRSVHVSQSKIKGFQKRDGGPEGPVPDLSRRHRNVEHGSRERPLPLTQVEQLPNPIMMDFAFVRVLAHYEVDAEPGFGGPES